MRSTLFRLTPALLTLALCCAACIDRTDWASKGPTDEDYSQQVMALGAGVYRDSCAACHGSDGSGSFGPALIGKGHKYSYEEQRRLVERGRRSMPGFGAGLSEEEIEAVLAHIRVGFFAARNN